MSKTRQKSHNELEHLRGIIKELSKENRSLKKQLKQYEKYEHLNPNELGQDDKDVVRDSEDTFIDLKKLIRCQSDSCGKGVYKEYELLGKVYGTCNICGDRKRLK